MKQEVYEVKFYEKIKAKGTRMFQKGNCKKTVKGVKKFKLNGDHRENFIFWNKLMPIDHFKELHKVHEYEENQKRNKMKVI